MRRTTTAVVLTGLLCLAGCGAGGTGARSDAPATTATATVPATASATGTAADAVVVDVRTPDEFAAGHLEGAVNIDASADDFATRIAELDPAARYIVYCRTGSRSAAAAAVMVDQGFISVTDAGGYEQAAADLGLPIATD